MGVVGAAIKGFGKALKIAKRNKASKQVFKNPKYKPSQKALKEGVVDRNVKSKEVFKIIKSLKKDKRIKAVGKGALIGGAAGSAIEYKRRKDRGDYKE
jgi:hypothetical protein